MRVHPLARRTRRRLRADEAAAHVRVQRRAGDAEQPRRLAGADPGMNDLAHIDSPINVDSMIHERYGGGMESTGLEGVVAASTRLSHVDGERGELIMAGYSLEEVAPRATFEEMTWLLSHGELPTVSELEEVR